MSAIQRVGAWGAVSHAAAADPAAVHRDPEVGAVGGECFDDGPFYLEERAQLGAVRSVTWRLREGRLLSVSLVYESGRRVERGQPEGEEHVLDLDGELIDALEVHWTAEGVTGLRLFAPSMKGGRWLGKAGTSRCVFTRPSAEHGLAFLHGRGGAEEGLRSLGVAWDVPVRLEAPVTRTVAVGQSEDAGVAFDDVEAPLRGRITRVVVRAGAGIEAMDVSYAGCAEPLRRGGAEGVERALDLAPGEHLVEALCFYDGDQIRGLRLRTSHGRSTPLFGQATESWLTWHKPGCVISGFHGRHDDRLRRLGVLFEPLRRPAGGAEGTGYGAPTAEGEGGPGARSLPEAAASTVSWLRIVGRSAAVEVSETLGHSASVGFLLAW